MIPTTGRSTSGSRRGRCLLGMVAVTTTVLTGTGCGLFSTGGGGGSDGADRTDRADHGEELTPAEEALCTIGDALAVTDDATLTDVLTDDDPSTAGPLLARLGVCGLGDRR